MRQGQDTVPTPPLQDTSLLENSYKEELQQKVHKLESIKQLTTSYKCPLFASRDSLQEAYNEAVDVIDRLPTGEKLPLTIALHVLLNSISDQYKRILEL